MDLLFPAHTGQAPTLSEVRAFYRNIQLEAQAGHLDDNSRAKLLDNKSGHGVLLTCPHYFDQAYVRPLWRALLAAYETDRNPEVLDVCSGTGSQALLFALTGSRVVALDHNPAQLAVLDARTRQYSASCERPLLVRTELADVATADLSAFGQFTVVYSHAGMTALVPAAELLTRIDACLRRGGLLILKSANPRSIWLSLTRTVAPDPEHQDLIAAAGRLGYEVTGLRGTTSLPRQLWRSPSLARAVDRFLLRWPRSWVHTELVLRKGP